MSHRTLLRERIARHGLADRPAGSALEATRLTTAVQAQDAAASHLGLRARAGGLTEADVLRAVAGERTVVRTWLLRSTIHLVPSSDLPWLVRLLGPAIRRRYRARWEQLGLTEAVRAQVLDALPEILADGPRPRTEILDELARRGVGAGGPHHRPHVHALVYASSTGLVCRGPDAGRASTFVLTARWLPDVEPGPSGDDALAELARRYFAAYSPATAADFGTWSGLAPGRAVALIRDELRAADVGGTPGFRLGEVEPARGTRLLPAFDNYLLGYADRSALIGAERYGSVYQGGMIRPVLLVDGEVAGTWSLRRAARVLTVSPFAPLTRKAAGELDRELADVARFLDTELTVGGRT